MYNIEFTKLASEQFFKLDKSIQEQIGARLERIKIRPEHFVEKLVGESGYKLKSGDYRIFLDILPEKILILILEINHRKKAYKK